MASRRAMTANRHVKQNQRQYAKDDRNDLNDRRHYVLGWDNKAKRSAREETIKLQCAALEKVEAKVQSLRLATENSATLLSISEEAPRMRCPFVWFLISGSDQTA